MQAAAVSVVCRLTACLSGQLWCVLSLEVGRKVGVEGEYRLKGETMICAALR